MNTKGLFLSVALILSGLISNAQELNTLLKEKLEHYISLTNQGEWNQVFDLSHPKLYTNVSKEELVRTMKQNEEGMALETSNLSIVGFSVPVEEGNETYVRIDYEADLKVKIKEDGIYDDHKPVMGLEQQFRDTYGQNSVKYAVDKKEFDIHARSAIMAIKSGNADWKFVEINMSQPKLMEFLFSPAIMDALVRVE